MAFTFHMKTTILYGENAFVEKMPHYLSLYNSKKVLYITGRRGMDVVPPFPGKYERKWENFRVTHEPSEEDVKKAVEKAEAFRPDVIVSIGGGSVIDVGKAISYVAYDERGLDFFFQNAYVEKMTIPHIAVPTTAGTGSEVTANAVIGKKDAKLSIRAQAMRPEIALLDPFFLQTIPPFVYYTSCMDALTQLIEAYVSKEANPVADMYCEEGLRLFQAAFHPAEALTDEQRLSLQLAACYSGIALSNSKLGIVHGVASVLGERYNLAHGHICASMLRAFCQLNIHVLRQQKKTRILSKYKRIAEILYQNEQKDIEDLLLLLHQYESALNPSLKIPGNWNDDADSVVKQISNASSTQGNPVSLSSEQVKQTLEIFYVK